MFAAGSRDFRRPRQPGELVDHIPVSAERERLWIEGVWDASWWCLECFGAEWRLQPAQVLERLRWADRNAKRARR